MLDTYDFDGDVWLCHSFRGHCHDFTAFVCKNHLPASISFRPMQGFKYWLWSHCGFVAFVDIAANRRQMQSMWSKLLSCCGQE